jgi:CheY-like chemotaxis protein
MKIMCIDDNVEICIMVKKLLEKKMDCQVTTVTSAIQALKILSLVEFDLIICDVEMPEMNGFNLANTLRLCRNETRIVFITGHPRNLESMQTVSISNSSLLMKPFDIDQLLA